MRIVGLARFSPKRFGASEWQPDVERETTAASRKTAREARMILLGLYRGSKYRVASRMDAGPGKARTPVREGARGTSPRAPRCVTENRALSASSATSPESPG